MKKLTHEDYLQKLQEKNIKIKPTEQYKGMENKINHKCICGNIWEVKPVKVLMKRQCGCNKNLTNKQYLQKLVERNIKVIPIEKYINATTKIKHKCTCGNIWTVIPNSVLNGTRCGCMKNSNDGMWPKETYKDRETILYILKVGKLYKIGITLSSIRQRYFSEKIKYDIIYENIFKNGEEAWEIENYIKENYKNYLYKGERIFKTTANTEIFIKNPITFLSKI